MMPMEHNREAMLSSMRATMAKSSSAPAEKPAATNSNSEPKANTTAAGEKPAEENTKPATVGEGEGGAEGEETGGEPGGDGSEGGEADSQESQDTTAEEQGGEPGSEEKASEGEAEEEAAKPTNWEDDDAKQLKDWGLDGLKFDEKTAKLAKIAKDNAAAVREQMQQVSALHNQFNFIGGAIVDHDLDALDQMAESIGGTKLPFDRRTFEDRKKEVVEPFNEIFDTLKAAFDADSFAVISQALAPIAKKNEGRLSKIDREALLDESRQEARKESGKPVRGKVKETMERQAHTNFVDLKSKDPAAETRMAVLKPYFASGLINMSRAYSQQPKEIDELGKAVEFMKNFKTKHLPEIRKQIEAELKVRKSTQPPPRGNKSSPSAGASKPAAASSHRSQNHFVANRLAQRSGV